MYKNRQKGIGMAEILVALLLLSIGVLGVSAVQVRALHSSTENLRKVAAIHLAKSYVERVRMNPTVREHYHMNSTSMENMQSISAGVDCFNRTCTPEQKANHDLGEIYREAVQGGFKFSTGCWTSNGLRTCIYVSWGQTLPLDSNSSALNCAQTVYSTLVIRGNASCIMLEGVR